MAITRIDVDRFVGKSSDIKPLDAPIGAVFYEYDTENHYDKTVDSINNYNGWKLRQTPSTSAENVKGSITAKTWLGKSYVVLMAGTDETNIEAGDLLVGLDNNGKFISYQAKINNPASTDDMLIFNDITGYDPTAPL